MLKVKAENDLKQLDKEMALLQKADGQLKIQEGLKDVYFKPLQAKQKHKTKQARMEAAVEEMMGMFPKPVEDQHTWDIPEPQP